MKRRPRRQEFAREKLGTSAFALLPLPADAVPLRPVGRSWGKVWQSKSVDPATFSRKQRLAGSGWCHHPQRKVSSGVLIMVRRNELACRDEWSRSLWQPRDAASIRTATCRSSARLRVHLPPALAENVRSVLNGDTALAAPLKAKTCCSARHGSFPRPTSRGSHRSGHSRQGILTRGRQSSAPGKRIGSAPAQKPPRSVNRPVRKR